MVFGLEFLCLFLLLNRILYEKTIWARSCKNVMSSANNKDADKPAPPRSLISTIVVRCLDSTTPSCYIRNFKTPASFFSRADWFESYLVENPEDRFSRDEAHMANFYPICMQKSHLKRMPMDFARRKVCFLKWIWNLYFGDKTSEKIHSLEFLILRQYFLAHLPGNMSFSLLM